MTLYLGRPGTALEPLTPSPQTGLEATYARTSQVRPTIGGGRVVDYAPGGLRTWKATWSSLTATELAALETWYLHPGPYALLDTTRINHLSAGQSTTTDADGITVAGTEAVTITTVAQTPVLCWTIPGAPGPGGGILTFADHPTLPGICWPADQPATWSMLVRGGGADPDTSVQAALGWLRGDGGLIDHHLGAPTMLRGDAWATATVTAPTPPPTAAYLLPRLVVDGASIDASASGIGGAPLASTWAQAARTGLDPLTAIVDDWVFGSNVEVRVWRPCLAMATTPPAWVPGTGVPLVTWSELADTYPWSGHHDITATILEVR